MKEELHSSDEALLQRCINRKRVKMNFLTAKRWICLVVFVWGLSCSSIAQEVTIQGHLLGMEKENLAEATLRCYQDSSFIKGTTTNAKGEFELKQLQGGKKYLLKFNYLGYKELFMVLNPTKEKLIRLGDITMSTESRQMQEVTVVAANRVQTEDRLMVFPTKEQIRHAYDGYNALNVLMIPALEASGTSVTYMGQTVFLCINGQEATQEEVQNLFPKDIKRVDLYPQGRPDYPEADVLIDYVTKERDYAGSVVLNGGHFLSNPSGGGRAATQYFQGKSELAFSVSDVYAHYTSRPEGNTQTSYTFPDETIIRTEETESSLNKENHLQMYANYLYKNKTQDFYASLRLNRNTSERENVDWQQYSNLSEALVKRENRTSQDINPALQLRYNVTLPYNQRLRAELYGSYGNNDYYRWYVQHRGEEPVSDYRNSTDETSWYGKMKVNYTKTFKNKSSLNLEVTEDLTHTKDLNTRAEKLSKISLNKSNTRVFATYNYRMKNKLNLQLRLAEHFSYTDTGDEDVFSSFFIPSFKISYRDKKQTFSLDGSLRSVEPSNANRTGDEYRRNEYEVFVGNPELKDFLQCTGTLRYNWDVSSRFTIFSYGSYYISTHQVYDDYQYDKERNAFVYQQFNGGKCWHMHYELGAQYELVPQHFYIRSLYLHNYYNFKLKEKYVVYGPYGSLSFVYMNKGWYFRLGCLTKSKGMSDSSGTVYHGFTRLTFNASYNVDNWHFELSTMNLGLKSYEESRLDYVNYKHTTSIREPRVSDNIVKLTVNYRFTFGKKKHKFDNTEVEDVNQSTISK